MPYYHRYPTHIAQKGIVAMAEHVLGLISDIKQPFNDSHDVQLPSEVNSLSR